VQLLNGSSVAIATATTDASGHYSFTGLPPGTYSVRFAPVAGYTFSAFPSGSTGPITLTSGQAYLDADIGLYRGSSFPACVSVGVCLSVQETPLHCHVSSAEVLPLPDLVLERAVNMLHCL
jgi:protocatechuate 3,4-dioxygenase beta subunit